MADPDNPCRDDVSRRVAILILSLIALSALLLRLWGIGYGLPHTMTRPDEERIAHRAFIMAGNLEWHPGGFMYPGLIKYVDMIVLRAYVLASRYQTFDDFIHDVEVSRPALHYLICRAVSAVFGAMTVVVVYLMASAGGARRIEGLLAAWLTAVCFLHVRDSHFATTDVAMTFFVALSLLFSIRLAESGRALDLAFAATASGLAAAAKYNGGIVSIAIPAAIMLSERARGRSCVGARAIRRLFLAGLIAFAGFVLGAPYSLIRAREMIGVLKYEHWLLQRFQGPPAAVAHLQISLPDGLGHLFFAASVAGAIVALWRHKRRHVVLLVFVVVFYAVIGTARWVVPRYVLPLVPVLALLASEASVGWLRRSRGRAAIVAAALLGGQSLVAAVSYDRLASRKDTRVMAAEWIEAHIPARTRIAVCDGYGAIQWNRDPRRGPIHRARLVDCGEGSLAAVDRPFLVTHEHPTLAWSKPAGYFDRHLPPRWIKIADFDPFVPGREGGAFFHDGDAFYLPYTGFKAVTRGGPIVRIWR
ncbi:MAG: glycosyltransferase family 39 protein, partial [Vicinamibacteria bacterium]|nr:glycosyltransferase family 39 protein [Vicinamibacteria bacterium]